MKLRIQSTLNDKSINKLNLKINLILIFWKNMCIKVQIKLKLFIEQESKLTVGLNLFELNN
jgi:hypothetical protein